MRRTTTGLIAVLALALVAACGGGPTDPGDRLPPGQLRMALVQGDSQEVAVTDTLPFDAVTRVEKGGEPLADQLVDWKVTADGCGEPFVSTTRTDSEGRTGNRAVAGTRAWTRPDSERFCRMEVRYALTRGDSVIAEVDTAFHYLVQPGPMSTNDLANDGLAFEWSGTRTIAGKYIADRHGNPALWRLAPDCGGCVSVASARAGTDSARTVTYEADGSGAMHAVLASGDTVATGGVTADGGRVRLDFMQ